MAEILASDGIDTEISYIVENRVKEYEFKNHYGYDYIAGPVKRRVCNYINKKVSHYYLNIKKRVRADGYYTVGLSYYKIAISELDEFITFDITRVNGTDRVIAHIIDFSEEKFKAKAKEMFERRVRQQEGLAIKAYA